MSITAPIAPTPPSWTMTTNEVSPLGLDTTPLLVDAEVPVSAVCTLTDISQGRGVVIPLGSVPGISGNVITQLVEGSLLIAGHKYRLSFVFDVGAGTVWEQILTIFVPV